MALIVIKIIFGCQTTLISAFGKIGLRNEMVFAGMLSRSKESYANRAAAVGPIAGEYLRGFFAITKDFAREGA